MTDISAVLQISTLKEGKKSSEGARLSVFKLLNGYIITTGSWESYGGFLYTDYFHEIYDMDSLWFWIQTWCEENLDGFFSNAEGFEVDHIKGEFPEIIYRQYTKGRKFSIASRPDIPEEIIRKTVQMAESFLLKKTSQITTAEAV